jgi:hypothetical protein
MKEMKFVLAGGQVVIYDPNPKPVSRRDCPPGYADGKCKEKSTTAYERFLMAENTPERSL